MIPKTVKHPQALTISIKALDWITIQAQYQDNMILDARQIMPITMLVGTAVVILFWSKEAAQLMHMLQEEIDNFLGRGPRPPMHPMPANDAILINKRRTASSGRFL